MAEVQEFVYRAHRDAGADDTADAALMTDPPTPTKDHPQAKFDEKRALSQRGALRQEESGDFIDRRIVECSFRWLRRLRSGI